MLDHLIDLGGSSGGARPKVLVGYNRNKRRLVAGVDALPAGYSHWLVKFRSSVDPPDMGAIAVQTRTAPMTSFRAAVSTLPDTADLAVKQNEVAALAAAAGGSLCLRSWRVPLDFVATVVRRGLSARRGTCAGDRGPMTRTFYATVRGGRITLDEPTDLLCIAPWPRGVIGHRVTSRACG